MVPGGTLKKHAQQPAPSRPARPGVQLTAGVAAMMVTAAIGTYLHFRPGLNALDRFGFTLGRATTHSWRFFRTMTWFGTFPALALGSVSAAIVARFTGQRDRWRALACLLGPPAAAAVDQFVIKPLVGRLYLGDFSFASGSVTVIAGVSTAWLLAVPSRFRVAAAMLGSLGVAMVIVSVVALQWHYPTDALGGVVLGVGVVLAVDGAAHILGPRRPDGPGRSSKAWAGSSYRCHSPTTPFESNKGQTFISLTEKSARVFAEGPELQLARAAVHRSERG